MPKPQDLLVLRVSTALPETATSIDSPGASEGLRGVYGRLADAVEARLRAILTPERLRALSASRFARPIARRSARAVFDVVAGFTHSQVLVACVRLGILETLAHEALSVEALAAHTEMRAERMRVLLDACVAVGVLHRRHDGRYTTTVEGRAIKGDPGVLAMIEHNQLLYRDLVDPVALLRGERAGATELAQYWPYDGEDARSGLKDPEARRYSELMAASQSFVAHEVLAAVDLSGRRRLLDVGGGTGAFVEAVAKAWPDLELELADLPAVARAAGERLQRTTVGDRVRCHGVDFFKDPLPDGADVISLVRILHDHDDGPALQLLRAVRQALGARGTLVIAEPMRREPSAERIGDVYFPLYFIAMGRGRARSREELVEFCRRAGFTRFSHPTTHVPLQTSVVLAHVR